MNKLEQPPVTLEAALYKYIDEILPREARCMSGVEMILRDLGGGGRIAVGLGRLPEARRDDSRRAIGELCLITDEKVEGGLQPVVHSLVTITAEEVRVFEKGRPGVRLGDEEITAWGLSLRAYPLKMKKQKAEQVAPSVLEAFGAHASQYGAYDRKL